MARDTRKGEKRLNEVEQARERSGRNGARQLTGTSDGDGNEKGD